VSKLDDLLEEFPEKSQRQLQAMWQALPLPMQAELRMSLARLPGDVKLWKMLLGLALTQFKIAFGDKHAVAIVGPANAGKSTLYNQFIRSPQDRAAVSPVPGTTRENQSGDGGLFSLTDTPGADAVGTVGEAEKEQALDAAAAADVLVLVFDASQGIRKSEQALYREFAALEKPTVVALNKIDLVRRDKDKVAAQAAANLGLEEEQFVPISAKTGDNVERVLVAIAKTEPEITAALGRALPEYRWRLAWTAITGAASTAAVIALTPLPIFDVVPLLAVQTSLVLGIARIYQYELSLERARELAVTFGLGFLGRTLFQELSKLGGPPGWLLSAAIASSTTVVMGYASIAWFERGERLTTETTKKVTRALTGYLLDRLKGLGKGRPSKQGLRERVTEALEQAPMAEGLEALGKPTAGSQGTEGNEGPTGPDGRAKGGAENSGDTRASGAQGSPTA
jgi:GTP-binding protein Era